MRPNVEISGVDLLQKQMNRRSLTSTVALASSCVQQHGLSPAEMHVFLLYCVIGYGQL